ncbi:hypothetical protein ACFFQF_07885 [Haladaptatus pallidirubidus]
MEEISAGTVGDVASANERLRGEVLTVCERENPQEQATGQAAVRPASSRRCGSGRRAELGFGELNRPWKPNFRP